MEFSRRNFLRGAGASLIAAPAIVSIANIMPVRNRLSGMVYDMNGHFCRGLTYTFDGFGNCEVRRW